jgi:hypothetical protein
MSYREPLPEACPPAGAEEITVPREVFRLVRTSPPTPDDFRSQRAEKPNHKFPGVSECQVRGLSVYEKKTDCEKLLKFPHMRTRKLCCVRLDVGAGMIQQTFQPSHHTWWPLAAFDILGNSGVETV